jgi:hypothetical protein
MDWLDWINAGMCVLGAAAALVIWLNLRAFKKGPPV